MKADLRYYMTPESAAICLAASKRLRQAILARRAILKKLQSMTDRRVIDAQKNVLYLAFGRSKERRFSGAPITSLGDFK